MRTIGTRIFFTLGTMLCLLSLVSCSENHTKDREESSYPEYPYNQELSLVPGVSIVKLESSHRHGYNSELTKSYAQLDAEGIDLLTALCAVTEVLDPIVLKKDLPEGEFKVVAQVESGGRDALTRRLCRAYSEAFECRVTRRMIELDAVAVSCPDPDELSLRRATVNEGVLGDEELSGSVRRTRFSSDMDTIIRVANYTSRTLAKSNPLPNRKALLSQVLVNETGIEDILKISLERDHSDPERLKTSLRNHGFTLTKVRRTVPAIVVEPEMAGEEWSYFSKSEMEAESPAIESPAGEGNLTDASRSK